jgi:hypothetical protein
MFDRRCSDFNLRTDREEDQEGGKGGGGLKNEHLLFHDK